MSGRPEILFLAHRIPYPPDKGDKIRSWRLLKRLSRDYDVHLAAFVDDAADVVHEDYLKSHCASVRLVPLTKMRATARSARGLLSGAPLSVEYFSDMRMRSYVDAVRARPLAAEIAFSSSMAQYIETPIKGRPRLVDFCDADSDKFTEYARGASFPMQWVYGREGSQLAAVETAIANWADASFAITPEEAAIFNDRPAVRQAVDWWSNGVDTEYFDPDLPMPPPSEPADIVFTGAMDYRANIDAAHFFMNEIWPVVRSAVPTATFAIVGARPAKSLLAYHGANGVAVTGRVDAVRPWLKQAALAIAPMRVARGVQNKILEAMAMGKPVVATAAGATGIRAVADRDLIVADSPQDFAASVIDLLNDVHRRDLIGTAARAQVVKNYQWEDQLSRFSDVLSSLIGSGRVSEQRALGS